MLDVRGAGARRPWRPARLAGRPAGRRRRSYPRRPRRARASAAGTPSPVPRRRDRAPDVSRAGRTAAGRCGGGTSTRSLAIEADAVRARTPGRASVLVRSSRSRHTLPGRASRTTTDRVGYAGMVAMRAGGRRPDDRGRPVGQGRGSAGGCSTRCSTTARATARPRRHAGGARGQRPRRHGLYDGAGFVRSAMPPPLLPTRRRRRPDPAPPP